MSISGGTSLKDENPFVVGQSPGVPMSGVVAPSDTPASGVLAVVALDDARNLCVNVKAGSGGGGLSVTDEASWTAGVSQFVPGGGVYNDSATALSSGQQGTERVTPNRAVHVNLRNNSGTEIGTLSNPVRTDPVGTTTQPVNLTEIAGNSVTIGAGNIADSQRIVQGTASTFNTGQVSVGSSATEIIASNSSRISVVVVNNGTTNIFLGGSGVTATTGQMLVGIAGYPMRIRSSAAVYGITSTGSQTVSYLEEVQ
jgi:hypothetical protein